MPESKGCGSAMRTAPIGLFYHDDESRLVEVAQASSTLTHLHPTALASAVATALLVRWALLQHEPSEFPDRLSFAMREFGAGGDEVAELVNRIPGVLDEDPEVVLSEDVLGLAWIGDEAVASALYCFCRSPRDYEATVLTGANTIGDSDSIACIAGAISGAFNGRDAIPKTWREGVENRQALKELALDLHRARGL